MNNRIKVVDLELGDQLQLPDSIAGYQRLRVLVRIYGVPVGCVELPIEAGCSVAELRKAVTRQLARSVSRQHLRHALERPVLPRNAPGVERSGESPQTRESTSPLVTVVVCTRDRTEDLKLCLDSLLRLDYPNLDILIVDNAPTDDSTLRLVGTYSRARYVREPRPGLDWARNRAIAEARGDVIAYTDDDVVVDSGWTTALATAFEDPDVMAVTGLVVPHELETEAQVLFEKRGGFGRGFERRYWRMDLESGEPSLNYLGAGKYGTGANMAFRLDVFDRIGTFDPALDVGTVTNGGGDLEMFFRVLKEGYMLVYEPRAVVRHRHRREYAQLRTQLTNNGIGFYSCLVRTALAYPGTRKDAVKLGISWFWGGNLRRLIRSYARRSDFPRDLIWAELWGSLVGLTRYPKARDNAALIAASGDGQRGVPATSTPTKRLVVEPKEPSVGVYLVDLCRPLQRLEDAANHTRVRVFVALDGRLIGSVDIDNHRLPVSPTRLRDSIADRLDTKLLGPVLGVRFDTYEKIAMSVLYHRHLPSVDGSKTSAARLPDTVSVSVVVATYDRPDDLRNCLRHLTQQESKRSIEIVVVDNHPASGLTPPVVAEFPGTVLVNEVRQGLAYARNRGFTASRGEVVVTTDDDVLVPADWLEKLVAPFSRPGVMIVTGNTLPIELETAAQRHFEEYGGLGRGFVSKEVGVEWFRSIKGRAVPTWELGATANAAFRATIFTHPEIGLMDEALGPGTPTGVGEDTYLFYKVLKAGFTLVYEPSAYVWHRHRREMSSLHNQLYNYSKGHVAYHLTTLLRDKDLRSVVHLAVWLPPYQLRRLAGAIKKGVLRKGRHSPLGRINYSLVLTEIRGNIAGPWGLWKSYRRVKREGRSDPYVTYSQRTAAKENYHSTELEA